MHDCRGEDRAISIFARSRSYDDGLQTRIRSALFKNLGSDPSYNNNSSSTQNMAYHRHNNHEIQFVPPLRVVSLLGSPDNGHPSSGFMGRRKSLRMSYLCFLEQE
jgi:hypothetical protein